EAHHANALGISLAVQLSLYGGGMHEPVQQERAGGGVKTIHVPPAFVPCGGGIEDATGGEVKIADHGAIVGRNAEDGFQVVGIAPLSGAGAKVVKFSEISVERAVFLHQKDDVVHAVLQRSVGIAWSHDSLAAGKSQKQDNGRGEAQNWRNLFSI